MRRIFFLFLCTFFMYSSLSAQGCLPDGAVFVTQTELNNFAVNYPDCTEILGELRLIGGSNPIEFADPITDLTPLSQITRIYGNLRINRASVTTLSGLENLTEINGYLSVIWNGALTDITALEGVDHTKISDLQIISSNSLSVCGLDNICEYLNNGGTVTLSHNGVGCNNVGEIMNSCATLSPCFPDGLTLTTQVQIDNFSINYPNCTQVLGNLTIRGATSTSITNLNGLEQLESIVGNLTILDNDNLNDFNGLQNIFAINGEFIVDNNNAITDFTGFEKLRYIKLGVEIKNNDALLQFTGLERLLNTDWYFRIRNNAMLTSLAGLNNVRVKYQFGIYDNPNLSMCSTPAACFAAIDEYGNYFYVNNNAPGCDTRDEVVENCSCLPDGITFTSQAEIDSFRANYPGCIKINGDVIFEENASNSIVDFDSLFLLRYIAGNLSIINNDALEEVDFRLLKSITGGTLTITGNDALTRIRQFGISGVSNLELYNNPNLYDCASICGHGIPENSNIHDNQAGCNSVAEVALSCLLSVELNNFYGYVRNKTAVLHWQTATETNNEGFEIQKSRDGVNWEKTGWQAGQGNSNEIQLYTYTDENPFFGVSYYRLKQVDFDGNFEFTDVASVEYKGKSKISLYPNPAEDILHITDLNGQSIQEISLYNQVGYPIQTNMQISNSINISQLASGVYILKITINGEVFFEKFVVK